MAPAPLSAFAFDEGAGTVAHDASGLNDATITGATWASGSACHAGGCLHFDATASVQVASPVGLPLGNAARSVTLWFNSDVDLNASPNSALFVYGQPVDGKLFGLITSLNAPDRLYFYGRNTDVNGSTPLASGAWHHAAVTYDGSTIRLYLDGAREAETRPGCCTLPFPLDTTLDSNGLTIGYRPDDGDHWTGYLDEVRFYDRALTDAEVASGL